MHTVTGPSPSATASGKLFRSMPAENEMGRRSPNTPRKRATRFIASTCSGCPERYADFSDAGRKSPSFSTTRVLENFTPRCLPIFFEVASSRVTSSTAWSKVGSFANAASGIL